MLSEQLRRLTRVPTSRWIRDVTRILTASMIACAVACTSTVGSVGSDAQSASVDIYSPPDSRSDIGSSRVDAGADSRRPDIIDAGSDSTGDVPEQDCSDGSTFCPNNHGGMCTDLSRDLHHCGTCDTDCFGGGCWQAMCLM